MVNSFIEFYLKRLFENKDNNKLPIFYSDRFRKLLKTIDNPIATKLLNIEDRNDNDDYKSLKTYIDIDHDSIDKITFIMTNKIKDAIDDRYPENRIDSSNINNFSLRWLNDDEINSIYNARQRSSMKINKFINEIFKNEYKTVKLTDEEKEKNKKLGLKSNSQILEDFVNKFKSKRKPREFELVDGDDILKYYLGDKYSLDQGPLGQSCMKYDYCQDFLKFYSDNDDKVSLLIMKNEENDELIDGRALVWNLDQPSGRTFMDRIYYINEYDIELFKDYAKKHKWLYKYRQNMSEDEFIVDSITGDKSKRILKVENMLDNNEYPYLDTLKYYERDDEILSNNHDSFDKYITLEDTEGNYVDESMTYEEMVERYKEEIIDDFEYYATQFMGDYVWDYIDDDDFMSNMIRDEIDYHIDDFEYRYEKDEIVDYIEKFADDDKIPENIEDMDEDEIFELVDELDIKEELVEHTLEERYRNYSAKDYIEETYGNTDIMDNTVYNMVEYYIDKNRCAEDFASEEDEYYLRERYLE